MQQGKQGPAEPRQGQRAALGPRCRGDSLLMKGGCPLLPRPAGTTNHSTPALLVPGAPPRPALPRGSTARMMSEVRPSTPPRPERPQCTSCTSQSRERRGMNATGYERLAMRGRWTKRQPRNCYANSTQLLLVWIPPSPGRTFRRKFYWPEQACRAGPKLELLLLGLVSLVSVVRLGTNPALLGGRLLPARKLPLIGEPG